MKNKAKSKGQLAKEYGIHLTTFLAWIKDIPELNLDPKRRLLTPRQIEMIYNHVGKP